MTSWSTSGAYSSVWETDENPVDLYAIRHVYPISGFNILLAAYAQSIKSTEPLDINAFIADYCKKQYGLNKQQANEFWQALKVAPYEIRQGEVVSPKPLTIKQVLDSTMQAAKALRALKPIRNPEEFEQYRLMTDIRLHYLRYEEIEKTVNSLSFNPQKIPIILAKLNELMTTGDQLDKRLIALNKDYLYPAELAQENQLRNAKVRLLYNRLSRKK
jgi:hypothetical protein